MGKKNKKEKKKSKKERRKKKTRTKHYDDDDDDDLDDERDSHAESDDGGVIDFAQLENNPLLEKAIKKFEKEKQATLSKIPEYIKKDFRQIGFTKWGKQMLPVIELGPYDVEPGCVRNQWIKMFTNCTRSKRNPSRLVMWYGTVWENRSEAYSFVAKTKVTSYEAGKAKGYHKLPSTLHRKISEGKELTEKEKFYVQGLDQMKKDVELPSDQRIQWMSRFTENYEEYFDTDEDEKNDIDKQPLSPLASLPPKMKGKLRKMNKLTKENEVKSKPIEEKTENKEADENNKYDVEINTKEDLVDNIILPKKKKSKQKKKVEVEFTAEVEHELMYAGAENVYEDKSEIDESYVEEEDINASSKRRKLKKNGKDSKVKKKKRKGFDAEDDKKSRKRKKNSVSHEVKDFKEKKMRVL